MLKIAIGMVHLVFLSFVLFVSRISTLNPLPMTRNEDLAKIYPFNAYWNVPTFLCHKHGFDFEKLVKNFSIEVNSDDKFRGDKIILLYDPGLFPMILKDKDTGNLTEVNGGIPQLGDLNKHLTKFEEQLEREVPSNHDGLAVIDFEHWRPIFRQNWNDQVIYKNMSLKYVENNNRSLSEEEVEEEATKQFETSARMFLEGTLKKAKQLRPEAKWGYYGYPYCLNYGKNNSADCPKMVKQENDEIFWLFRNSDAFYLSVYSSKTLSKEDHKHFVTARMNEAARLAAKVSKSNPPHVYAYTWFRHHDSHGFIKRATLETILKTIKGYYLGGVAIWGSSKDLKTKKQCRDLYTYVEKVLGPIVLKLKQS